MSKIKDSTVEQLMPNTISECALHLGPSAVCMSGAAVKAVGRAVGLDMEQHETTARGPESAIVDAAKEATGCKTERCVLTKLAPKIGEGVARREILGRLKAVGPTDASLLSNIHIDAVMRQWMMHFPDFFAFNFNMRNYASYSFEKGHVLARPDSLAVIGFDALMSGEYDGHKYKCCGCIINSDTYQGEGKHWMALFADARGPLHTVEFFNSSGNAPAPEWINWLVKTKNMMDDAKIVKVTTIRHQASKSECGLYSLFYVWARLNGVRPEYFMGAPVPDQLMFEFRHHLFEDPNRRAVKQFHWDEYKRTVRIEWEK